MANRAVETYGSVMRPNEVERRRVRVLAETFDDNTIGHLGALGVGAGWRCLEVGAGEGSVARWLSGQVGDATVVATDVDTRFVDVPSAPNVEVLRHDVTSDPRPGDPFDLVHTRNVLVHLPTREQVLDRLVSWLAPGGWLLVEESIVVPGMAPSPLLARFLSALVAVLADRVGSDLEWALTLPGPLRARGLVNTGGAAFVPPTAPAGRTVPSSPAELWRLTLEQLRPAITAAGLLTPREACEAAELLDDPATVVYGIGVVSAWGRRP